MHLHHEAVLDAQLPDVWARATDCRVVAASFPGGTITEATHESFTGEVAVRVGLLTLTFAGAGRYEERDEAAHRAVICASGRQRWGPGRADIRMCLQLQEVAPGTTRAVLDTELSVNGTSLPLAGPLGARIAAPLVQSFLRRLACVEEH
ncbi:CoxG family protein [Arsenicicoccus cauae]|uniref:SRPBCC family protein n=1 Tax=Arsenicicoccus cauae TaxID=2663847 RepID=A0A6I3I850_9MICO|nr:MULTISPECIES: hypothetical protein [Arsenicicoccus]MTB72344.1 hypothetical protein [Arsenicicoccus cauae]